MKKDKVKSDNPIANKPAPPEPRGRLVGYWVLPFHLILLHSEPKK